MGEIWFQTAAILSIAVIIATRATLARRAAARNALTKRQRSWANTHPAYIWGLIGFVVFAAILNFAISAASLP